MGKKYQDTVEILIEARNNARAELEREEARQKHLADAERQRAQASEQRARELADVERQISHQRLKSQGRTLDANLADIRNHYSDRIAAAKRANDAELADRLKTLRELREAEARSAAQARAQQAKNQRIQNASSRFTSAIGTVAAFEAAARVGDAAIQGVTAAIKGDLEAVADSIRSAPVFGTFFGLGQSIREAFTGEQAEIDALRERDRIAQEKIAQLNARNNAYISARADGDRLRQELALLTAATAQDRERLQITQQRLEVEKRADELVRQAGNRSSPVIDELRVLALERERIALDELAKRQQDLERERLTKFRDVDAQIEQIELTRMGRVAEAERASIIQVYTEKVEAAKRAGDEEYAQRLIVLGNLKLAEAEERREEQLAQARINLERQILQVRLQNSGEHYLAEKHRIADLASDRIAQAKKLGQEDIAKQEEILANLKIQQVVEKENAEIRKQGLRESAGSIRDQIGELQDSLRNNQQQFDRQSAPIQNAETNRFLTGVREQTLSEDRARQKEIADQGKAIEMKIGEAKTSLDQILEALRSGPRVVGVNSTL